MNRCIDCRGWFKPRNKSDYRCLECKVPTMDEFAAMSDDERYAFNSAYELANPRPYSGGYMVGRS